MPPSAPTSPPPVVYLPLKPGEAPSWALRPSAWGRAGVGGCEYSLLQTLRSLPLSCPRAGREPLPPTRCWKRGVGQAWGGRPWAEVHFPTVDKLSLPFFTPPPARHPQPMIS